MSTQISTENISQRDTRLSNASLEFEIVRSNDSPQDFSSITEEMKHLHQSSEEYWYAMGSRLRKIAANRLYRTGGFRSFSDYCSRGLGFSRQHAYKVMKVVEFVNDLWAKADTPEKRVVAQRLFTLGFTKIYILHTLPQEMLKDLLDNGVTIPSFNNFPAQTITIEESTIGQLRRALSQDPKASKPTTGQFNRNSAASQALIRVLNSQIKTLLCLTEECLKESQENGSVNESLLRIRDYASSINQGFDALTNNTDEMPEEASSKAVIIDHDDQFTSLLEVALSSINIKAVRSQSLEEAKGCLNDGCNFIVANSEDFFQLERNEIKPAL
jgi:hypothetical protein